MERLNASSLPGVVERPDLAHEHEKTGGGDVWIVTVYDNDFNTVDEVMYILMAATGCDEAEASMETWEIHNLGKSVVHCGDQKECEDAAGIIAQIGIDVKVSQE